MTKAKDASKRLERILKDFESKVNGLILKSSSIVRERDAEPDYWLCKAIDIACVATELRKDLVNHYDPNIKGHP